jgi:hypothetical protein
MATTVEDLPPPPRNLMVVMTRRAGSPFDVAARRIANPATHLYTCAVDSVTPRDALVAGFASWAFSTLTGADEPRHVAIAVEDPALLDTVVDTGLATELVRCSVLARRLRLGDSPRVHVLVSGVAGLAAGGRTLRACEGLQQRLRDAAGCPDVAVAGNSLLPDCGATNRYDPELQEALWHFFDQDALAAGDAAFAPDEREIAESLTAKLAFVQDLRTMLTASRLSLLLGDVAAIETAYHAIQGKVLRGEVLSDPDALAGVVAMEQGIRGLLDALGRPTP